MFTYYLTRRGTTVGHGHEPEEEDVAIEMETEPTGEWSEWTRVGDVERRWRSGLRTWVFFKDTLLDGHGRLPAGTYYANQKVSALIEGYFTEERGGEGLDICLYCGHDTTGCRVGWDCGYCGGN